MAFQSNALTADLCNHCFTPWGSLMGEKQWQVSEYLRISALSYNTGNVGSSFLWSYLNKGLPKVRREGQTTKKGRGYFCLQLSFVQGTGWHLLNTPIGSIPKAKQVRTCSAGESQQGLELSKLLTDHHCWDLGSSRHVQKQRNLYVVRTGLMGIKSIWCIQGLVVANSVLGGSEIKCTIRKFKGRRWSPRWQHTKTSKYILKKNPKHLCVNYTDLIFM